jgi:glycosyltransferase involved in cell wall biosynthesis
VSARGIAKVVLALPGLAMGGTERHVTTLACRLDRRRFDPLLVCTSAGGPLEEALAEAGVPVHVLGFRGLTARPSRAAQRLFLAADTVRRFAAILRSARADVLHAFLPEACVLGAAAGRLAGTRAIVVSKRAMCYYKAEHPWYAFLENLANMAADAITVNSVAVQEDVRKTERFTGKKFRLMYNGIDPLTNPPWNRPDPPPEGVDAPPGTALVTYVANLRDGKGHLCLVEAAREVLAECPDVLFLLVGREDREAVEVRRRIREAGLEGKIILAGPRWDVPAILRATTVVAHPGEQEGFSNAILEAMALGLPVVAARAGGNPEAVDDGETGILFPAGDATALARGIIELLRDPARARKMGEAARRRVQNRFTTVAMVSNVECMYEDLLASRPP